MLKINRFNNQNNNFAHAAHFVIFAWLYYDMETLRQRFTEDVQ